MALDQNVSPAGAAANPGPAIDNELPAYRAISPSAVVGLIAGVLAITSFASLYFLAFAVVAVLLGSHADRRIRRHPDAYTGLGLAHAAITLGLVFGLASVTIATVQSVIRNVNASRFARKMAGVLQDGTLADGIWYTAPAEVRDGRASEDLYKEMLQAYRGPAEANPNTQGFVALKKRLESTPGQKIRFAKIENTQFQDLDTVASALMEIDGPPSKEFPDPEEFALVVIRGRTAKGHLRWKVESLIFPYKPATYVPVAPHVDDGHGHSH